MAIQLTLTDEDAQRYLKWAANIRQPREAEETSPRSASPARRTAAKTATTTSLVTRREELQDMRKWAAKHGFAIAAKGRIPQVVQDAYAAAH